MGSSISAMLVSANDPPPDDMLYEVVDGYYVEKISCAYSIWLACRLATVIHQFVRREKLGQTITEMVFILDQLIDLRRRPDVAFVSADTWPIGQPPPPTGDWAIVPDLAVEVVSPRDDAMHLLNKVDEYFRYGVREVWLAIPDSRMVYCYSDAKTARILKSEDTLSSPLLPGWSIVVGDWLPLIDGANGTR